MLVSRRKYAEMRGVSHTAVNEAVREGKIPLVDGKIDPAVADAAWERNRDACQPSKLAAAVEPVQTSATPAPDVSGEPSRADAQREYWQLRAEEKKLDLRERESELISAEEEEKALGEVIETSKNLLLLIPENLADRLAASRDSIECRNMVEHEIRLALEAIERRLAA
jgi:hypothetical protein